MNTDHYIYMCELALCFSSNPDCPAGDVYFTLDMTDWAKTRSNMLETCVLTEAPMNFWKKSTLIRIPVASRKKSVIHPGFSIFPIFAVKKGDWLTLFTKNNQYVFKMIGE